MELGNLYMNLSFAMGDMKCLHKSLKDMECMSDIQYRTFDPSELNMYRLDILYIELLPERLKMFQLDMKDMYLNLSLQHYLNMFPGDTKNMIVHRVGHMSLEDMPFLFREQHNIQRLQGHMSCQVIVVREDMVYTGRAYQ
jgi:hypothetical protein